MKLSIGHFIMSTKVSNSYLSNAYISIDYAKVSKSVAYANFSAPNKPNLLLFLGKLYKCTYSNIQNGR